MTTYAGPAMLGIADSEPDIPVQVRLQARAVPGELGDWSGVVQATSPNDRARLYTLRQGRLRLPSGQTGSFVANEAPGPFDPFSILGSDAPPF